MKIGFIGLGNLGTPIAQNILERGHELWIYNRTPAKMEPLAAQGAFPCAALETLATECTLICTMVSDDAALKAVAEQLLQFAKPGTLHISMSTVLPQTAQELSTLHQEKGLRYLAAPVFGRPEAARARKLNFVLSGDEAARKEATSLLQDAGGAGVWEFGEAITAANTVKLSGNFVIAAALEAIGESVALAQRSGIDPKAMWNLFGQTIFNTPLYQNYSQVILEQRFDPAAFTMQLGLKDMNLVLQQAARAGQAMPLAQLLQQHMQQLVQNGKNHLDWSAVATAAQ